MAPFSSLRRQHAIHAASGKQQPSKPRTSTLRIRRLSILPEEDESSASASCSSSPSSSPSPTPTKAKRLSKYGKANVLSRQAGNQDLTFERPRPAPCPPTAAGSPTAAPCSRRQTVRLSSFEFDLSASLAKKERRLSRIPEGSDMVVHAVPASPTLSCASDVDVSLDGPDSVRLSTFAFDVPTDFSLNSDDQQSPPPRAVSPASSLSSAYTSFSTSSSSSDLPLTPTSSDEDWPASPSPSAKSPVLTPAPTVPIRPLVIHKTKARSTAVAAATAVKVAHDEHEDDATWYARELSARFALLTPPAFLNSFPRPDSTAPAQSSPRTPSSSSAGRSRFSKPLPAIPPPPSSSSPTRGPSPQLDPTYTHARPALPLSPPPARLRRRVSLTIKVPPVARPPPSSPIPCDVDVGEIFDDGDAWAPFDFEHGRPASGALSPPRLPESPASACPYSFAYESERERRMPVIDSASSSSASSPTAPAFEGPVPAIVVSALEPPAGAVPATVPVLAQTPTFVDEKEEEIEEEEPSPLLRSRWSSSTLSSLVDSSHSPISSALSPKTLSFHIGNVARRVVVRSSAKRSSSSSPGKAIAQSAIVENVSGGAGLRRRMSEASVGSCESGESGASAGSNGGGLRRKAIPVELFMRGM